MMRHCYKRGTNRLIFAIILLIAGHLIAAESGAAVESGKNKSGV